MSDRGSTALRKHLLILRATVERAELAESVGEVRHALRWTSLFKSALPGFAAVEGLPLLVGLLRKYPVVGAAASLFTARIKPRTTLRGVLRVVVVVALLWQGWQLSRRLRSPRATGSRARPKS
jgi:hypothetical protein